ncbi:MAG: hypothetical protein GY798_23025 [Hyphomicrobiales bacterium]|nr:hypothetical protein [Hyphomicrobiales bacterium]
MVADAARFVLTLSCPDRRGIVAAVANCITAQDCNIVESAQYGDPDAERFFMRVSFLAPAPVSVESFSSGLQPVATAYHLEQDIGRVDHSMSPEEFVAIGRDNEATVLARAIKSHLEHRVLINGERTVVFR